MIPIHLNISGFLSYRQPVSVDFSSLDLACIAGPNGAGKSSLLDAMTWALFGQARKRDDSLINAHIDVQAAEVVFIFAYEGNVYRIQRTKPRDKSTILEFHILQAKGQKFTGFEPLDPDLNGINDGRWRPLTERTLRETEACIQRVLHLDYETFVNASFFLQGKADQFTQQRPGDRKRILSSILGLEVWESYRQKAADLRRSVESELDSLRGGLSEIQTELAEEETRKKRLKQLEGELSSLENTRKLQETALESIRKVTATLQEQSKLVDALGRQMESAAGQLKDLEQRAAQRQQERDSYAGILSQAESIQAAYQAWQDARADLAHWDEIAEQFREHEKRRSEPLNEINALRARLAEQQRALREQYDLVEEQRREIPQLQKQLEQEQEARLQAKEQLDAREALDLELQDARQRQAEARAENPRLKGDMDELKERIDSLEDVDGANCPLCGQPLSPEDRQALIDSLIVQGKEMGTRYRANLSLLKDSDQRVKELEQEIFRLSQAEGPLRMHTRICDQLVDRLDSIEKTGTDWDLNDAPRLAELEKALAEDSFAPEAQARLAAIDAELKSIGYDAASHDAVRQAETQGRKAEAELRTLERAQAALAPLERELNELRAQIEVQSKDVARQQLEHGQAVEVLEAAKAKAPDLAAAERELLILREQENRLHMEVGGARQKVLVLDDLKVRRKALESRSEELSRLSGQYRQLERAFGKDGVPALLIEQALPEIESKSNEILDRLSGGAMSVRFVTQAAYKDKHREDLKETLDIQISDSAGIRDYEMFSGGEAFRVNFAVRLALAEVLAQRAGARLQTLVIDEGFGSQDAQGRQRLIEAINMVRQDFAKILVITHIDELKDSFPNRIEVEKTATGSQVRVM